jgi:cytochrome c peroxidase
MRLLRHAAHGIAIVVVVAAAVLGAGPRPAAAPAVGSDGVQRIRADLGSRPSHHGIYRAEVVATGGPFRPGRAADWTVRILTADGHGLESGDVAAALWLLDVPDHERPLRVEPGRAPGEFRLRRVRTDGPGWWSLKLHVRSPRGEDSLAFNLIIAQGRPDRSRWSARELERIRSLWIGSLGPIGPDPSNRYADDDRAVALGHALFFEPRLSSTGTVSCASCHKPDRDFQDDVALAVGVGRTDRRTMPVAGTAHSPWLFWDGRKDSQWAQALGPLESPVEHGGTRALYAHVIAEHHRAGYEAVFGPLPDLRRIPRSAGPVPDPAARAAWHAMSDWERDAVTGVFVNVGKALAAYQRQLQFGPGRFDHYAEALLTRGHAPAGLLSEDEVAGLRLFIGRAGCVDCHNGPLLTNHDFHNTGVPEVASLPADLGRAAGAPAVLADEFNCRSRWSDAPPEACVELEFMVAGGHELARAFKTPTLRNVAERGPYMHAGQLATLAAVITHYDRAAPAPAGHTEVRRLRLSRRERGQLEAYLRTLSGPMATEPALLAPPRPTTVGD